MAVPTGTLLYCHGANTDYESLSGEETRLRTQLKERGWSKGVRLGFIRWRQEIPIRLGDWQAAIPDVTLSRGERIAAVADVPRKGLGELVRLAQDREVRVRAISTVGAQFLSDVLSYRRYRRDIFRVVHKRLKVAAAKDEGPVVALGLSLGGIILVDYMAEFMREGVPVAALVTVGTQAPMMYALGCLDGVTSQGALSSYPQPFGPWLNVYNPADLLSFVAQPVFPFSDGIRDVRVSGAERFPASHSAYWEKDGTWEAIADAFRVAEAAGPGPHHGWTALPG